MKQLPGPQPDNSDAPRALARVEYRPRRRYSAEDFTKAIHEAKGLVSQAAVMLGCARQTVYEAVKRWPTVAEALEDSREKQLDRAESKLFEAVEAGEGWAITYFLSTQGKRRGYSLRGDALERGDGPVTFTLRLGKEGE